MKNNIVKEKGMKPATLHEKKINIQFDLSEKNMALFLSNFFESCGIVTTKYDNEYLPDKQMPCDTTIYIVSEKNMSGMPIELVHSSGKKQNCYDRIDVKNCEKILNYLFQQWKIPYAEVRELNKLFQIYVKNDYWRISWLVENMQYGGTAEKRERNSSQIITNYIQKRSINLRSDLSHYSGNENHYLQHMRKYSFYREHDADCNSMERYKFVKCVEKTGFGGLHQYNSYDYLGHDLFMANFYRRFMYNFSIILYRRLEKTYPNSEVLYQLENMYKYYSESYKINAYNQRAFKADPTNYLALFSAAENLCKKGLEGEYLRVQLYVESQKLLSRLNAKEYTTVDELLIKIGTLAKLKKLTNDMLFKVSLENMKTDLSSNLLFENIFTDMSYQGSENKELDEHVKKIVMKNASQRIDKEIQ